MTLNGNFKQVAPELLKMHVKITVLPLMAVLALAACGSEAPAPEPSDTAPAQAIADAPEGVTLTDAEIRMPAVAGRPGVAYFTIAADAPRTIVGVSVLGAGRAELHESGMTGGAMTMAKVDSVELTSGEPVAFAPGGLHVMLFDMDASLAAGGTADLTVTFASGDKASIIAPVTAPGGMSHDMEGMN